MALEERETVVVEDKDRSNGSWIIPLVVLLLVILAFFYFGGMNIFNGNTNEPDTINIDTPDSVNTPDNVEVPNSTSTPDNSGTQPTNP